MEFTDLLVQDEVQVTWKSIGRDSFSGAAVERKETVTGTVVTVTPDAFALVVDSAKPPTNIPRVSVIDLDLRGLNPHRLDPATVPVLVRVFPGHRQTDAAAAYAEEASVLARAGYLPVAHSWAAGEPGVGRVMALGALAATALRPEGALVVTFVHRTAGGM